MFLLVLLTGTMGYWLLSGREYSLMDCLYMTMITVTTIGFGEVIDLSHNPAGRIFTIVVAVAGIGLLTYLLSTLTAFVVGEELKERFTRKRMEKIASGMKDHYIICGVGLLGRHIVNELAATNRSYVVVDVDRDRIESLQQLFPQVVFIDGDATNEEILLKAGIRQAKGLFAATDDDNKNLVITLISKQLNPSARVVARCHDVKYEYRVKRVGADAVVCSTHIGGLRMASEMVRPTAVSFLDMMLRGRQTNLRVEEEAIPEKHLGSSISQLGLKHLPDILLLAVNRKDGWVYNPREDYVFEPGDKIVFLSSPEQRKQFQRALGLR